MKPSRVRSVKLVPLEAGDKEQFVRDNQEAFLYGATEEFGLRNSDFEEDGQIISRRTILRSIGARNAEAYRIIARGEVAGGVVIRIDQKKRHGDLDLLFVAPRLHSLGIGQAVWRAVERLHPEVLVWETCTPYFEKRNIHFYVNRLGFHIVEFFNSHHRDPRDHDTPSSDAHEGHDGMFRFEKRMPRPQCSQIFSAHQSSLPQMSMMSPLEAHYRVDKSGQME